MLLGELEIGGGKFLRTLQDLDTGFSKFIGDIGKVGAIGGGIFAVFEGLQAVMDGFKDTIDLSGALGDMRDRTGEAVGDLVVLRQAFTLAGMSADNVEPFVLKLQDAIAGVNEEGKSTAGALKALGTSAGELRMLPAIAQIEKLQDGFAKLDQTTKVQVGRDLFGKQGGAALSLIGGGSALEDARKQAAPLADLLERNATSFEKLGDIMDGLKLKTSEFFGGALSKIAPEATSIGDALAAIDFKAIGESVGSMVEPMLKLAEVLSGPLATGLNILSEGLSNLLGGAGPKTSDGRSQRLQREMADILSAKGSFGDSFGISSMQKSGLGGGFAFSGAESPIISESRRQSLLLEEIARNTRQAPVGMPLGAPAV